VIATSHDSRYGALAGFLLALRLLRADRRAGRAWDELVIEASSAVFFGGLALAACTVSHAPMGDYGTAGSVGWLALTAWASLAIRRPFTLGIARTMAPAHVHNTRAFFHVNAVITTVWAAAFTLNAAALALLIHLAPGNTTALIAAKIAGFVLPAAFTSWYPKAAAARRGAQPVALGKDLSHV
jgi:hypothetical protein